MKKIITVALSLIVAVAVTSCGSKSLITKGSASKIDSLSYALGANIGYGVAEEMKDIPFNYELVNKGLEEGALLKSKQTQEQAIEILRDYFMNKRSERAARIAERNAEADSIALAADSTAVISHEAADKEMFTSVEECDSVSYAFGNDIGNNVRNSKLRLQTYWLNKGINDAREGKCDMTFEQVNAYLQNYFMVVRPQEAKEHSEKWLSKMEGKSGVKKTESGLLYKVVAAGDESVKATDDRDVVKVYYVGRTSDGEVFDTNIFDQMSKERQDMLKEQDPENYKTIDPAEFPLNRVIKGWTEGMKLVGKGGKITLYIPSELAYGERGAGQAVGPNEALQFEVELVDVTPYVEPAPAEEAAPAEAPAAEAAPTEAK